MSDEAHFHHSGYVNKQDCRYWRAKNSRNIHELPLHSQKVTVWCGRYDTREDHRSLFFSQDENEETATVNGATNRK